MSKARITYRFDEDGRRSPGQSPGQSPGRSGGRREEEAVVIPLRADEWEARDERTASRAEREPVRVYDTQPLNQFTTDFGAWQSPFEAEVDRLERIIRESGQPAARSSAARRPAETANADEQPSGDGWGDDDGRWLPAPMYDAAYAEQPADGETGYYRLEPPRGDGPIVLDEPALRYGRSSRGTKSLFRAVSSISGAVITGLLFGLLIISLFNGGDETPVGSLEPEAGPSDDAAPDNAAPVGTAGEPSALPTQGMVSVDIPGRTYFVLQFGLFSSMDRAETAIGDLQKLGLAGAAESSSANEHYVFAGLAATRDDALVLDHLFEAQQLETFIKEYQLPAASQLQYSGADPKQAEQFFAQTDELARMIGGLAYVHLEESSPTPLEPSSLEALQTAHQGWATSLQAITAGVDAESAALLQSIGNDMNSAVTTIGEYAKNPSRAYMWQAQAAVMRALIAEKSLLAAIGR